VAEDQCCDGCGKQFGVDDLHVVSINGTEMICCSDCRQHARRAAERTFTKCERCESSVPEAHLERVELLDRSELYCCPECRQNLAANGDLADDNSTSDRSDASSRSTTTNGGSTSTGRTRSTASGTTSVGSSSNQDDDSAKPAKTDNVCDQCGDSFTIELYNVVTVDNRTEEFCPDCKREAVEEGIVRDVQLRRAQAFEVLGLTGSADEQAVREAYLRRAKEAHPDRDDGSRSEFMLVKRAYERLAEEN
jgi:hypothetical protein